MTPTTSGQNSGSIPPPAVDFGGGGGGGSSPSLNTWLTVIDWDGSQWYVNPTTGERIFRSPAQGQGGLGISTPYISQNAAGDWGWFLDDGPGGTPRMVQQATGTQINQAGYYINPDTGQWEQTFRPFDTPSGPSATWSEPFQGPDGRYYQVNNVTNEYRQAMYGPSTSSGGGGSSSSGYGNMYSSGGGGGGGSHSTFSGTYTNISDYGPTQAAIMREQLQASYVRDRNQYELGLAQLGLGRDQLAENMRQFDANYALNVQQLGLNRATALANVISLADPAAVQAFWEAGGGNLFNAAATGNSAISQNALTPAAMIYNQMSSGLNPGSGWRPGAAVGGSGGGLPQWTDYTMPGAGGGGGGGDTGGGGGGPGEDTGDTAPEGPPAQQNIQTLRWTDLYGNPTATGQMHDGIFQGVYMTDAQGNPNYNSWISPEAFRLENLRNVEPILDPITAANRIQSGGQNQLMDIGGGRYADMVDYTRFLNRGPNTWETPAYASGTPGFVRDTIAMVGDAPGRRPFSGPANPEIVYNPTRAPMAVMPMRSISPRLGGGPMPMRRFAEGTIDPAEGEANRMAKTRPINTSPSESVPAPVDPGFGYVIDDTDPNRSPGSGYAWDPNYQGAGGQTGRWFNRNQPSPGTPISMPGPVVNGSTAPTSPTDWGYGGGQGVQGGPSDWFGTPRMPASMPGPVVDNSTANQSVDANQPADNSLPVPGWVQNLGPDFVRAWQSRTNVQVPNISWMDARWNRIPRSTQQYYLNSLQARYGVPAQDWYDQILRYRMPGLGRSGVRLGV